MTSLLYVLGCFNIICDLDVNMGEQILLRLRPAHSPDDLLPEAAVVETMLHEVCNACRGTYFVVNPYA